MTLTRKRTLAWPDLTELSWFPFLEPVIRVAGVPGERPQERPSAERLPEPPGGPHLSAPAQSAPARPVPAIVGPKVPNRAGPTAVADRTAGVAKR